MSHMGTLQAKRPEFDELLTKIARYTDSFEIRSDLAFQTARYCLIDSIACGLLALEYPACTKLLGPSVEGAQFKPLGAKIFGTSYQLEPIRAAFNIGTMIRWLDFNDTWLAAEWGHPSDNLGAIWAVADYLSRKKLSQGKEPLKVQCVLKAMIKAYEIQGILALENCFNRVGMDHVLLVRIASTAVAAKLLGCDFEKIRNAICHAFIDGGSLRIYRHAPNTGSRKSWAGGDASSRGVDLALKAKTGEMGYPSTLSAEFWGYEHVKMRGKKIILAQEFGSYVMENILFKISFPAEFHAQTAVEAALCLHHEVKNRLDEIDKIVITTQESAYRIINKIGELANPADRDHCIQYMVAIPLIFGRLNADDYEDRIASDQRIDMLRAKMLVELDERYTKEYLQSDKRSIANAVQVFFKDKTHTKKVQVEYPLGHKRRRSEAIPLLLAKFKNALCTHLGVQQCQRIMELCKDEQALTQMNFNEFSDLFYLGLQS